MMYRYTWWDRLQDRFWQLMLVNAYLNPNKICCYCMTEWRQWRPWKVWYCSTCYALRRDKEEEF